MEVKLIVSSPVLISNDYINVTNMIINKDSLYMLDMDKLIDNEPKIDELAKYFLNYKLLFDNNGNYDQYDKIKGFYNKINTENYKIEPEIKADTAFNEVINSSNNRSLKAKDVILTMGNYEVINNKKTFVPFIPGATIKGAIRNAVRNFYVKNLNDLLVYYKGFQNKKYNIDNATNKKLDKVLYLDDIFRFIEITDFYSNNYKLHLYQISRKKLKYGNKGIPFYAICISSGTFNGKISIVNSFDHLLKTNTSEKQNVINKIKEILGIEFNNDVDSYKIKVLNKILEITINYNKEIIDLENEKYGINIEKPLLIGFGGGIEIKTVIRSLNKNVYEREKLYIEHKNGNKHVHIILNDDRIPSTAWTIDNKKFGVLEVIY